MRLRQLIRLSSVVAVVIFTAMSAGAHLQGVWSGSITINDLCGSNNQPVQWSSAAKLHVFETGDDFMSNLEIEAVPEYDQNCQQTDLFTTIFPIFGNSPNQTTFTGVGFLSGDLAEFDVSGTVSGTSMSFTLTFEGFTTPFGTANLTQIDAQQPSTAHSGSWAGPYTFTQMCANGSFSSNGTVDGSVFHTGSVATGIFFFQEPQTIEVDAQGNCQIVAEPDAGVLFMMVFVDGNTLNGVFVPVDEEGEEDGEVIPFIATVSGNTVSGSATEFGVNFTFTLTRSSTGIEPTITQFRADPPVISPGDATRLIWSTVNASSVSIDQGIGQQPTSGFVIVRPTTTTPYTLTAGGPGGTATATTTVIVGGPKPADVVVVDAPRGFVQRAGVGGGTDKVTVANIGGTETSVMVSPSGTFFTVKPPESFTIGPRSTRDILITGTPQPPGPYQGQISFSGEGVRSGARVEVRMLSAAPPTGTVDPRANVSREEISTAVGQSGAGSVSFTNNGNATMLAIAVADVPWIVPQSGVITIGPGQTVPISYTVDPNKRPADLPIGAVTGKISLVFIRGTGGSATTPGILGDGGASTSTVSVTLVYVVKPGVSPGSPPPLGAGELALFVPGIGSPRPSTSGDLFLSNRQSSAVSDLKLYLLGSGVAQSSSLPTLQGNAAVALPSLTKSVFGTAGLSGTQVRSANVTNVSVAATRTTTASSAGTYGTALPVFRSDRGVSTGGTIVLSGLSKSSNERLDLFVQEMSGTGGNVQIDFLNSSGQALSSVSRSVTGFGFLLEFGDAAPAGTVSARITNSGAAKLAAYGLVENNATGDAWLTTDPAADDPSATAYVIPLMSAGQGEGATLYLANRGSSSALVTIDVQSPAGGKRRAAGKGPTSPPPMQSATSNVTLAPSESTAMPIVQTSGYIRLTVPAGAISAVGRSIRGEGNAAFGTALPAVPVSLALRSGDTRRFAGVDDASVASRNSNVPATFVNALALTETSGQAAKVRVTLAYTLSAGSLATAQATSSKEYSLSPSQYLLLGDLATDVIGPQRNSFGDLRNMTVDVQVIEGAGRVLPFLQSIDNGSGDSLVRTE